MTQDIAGHIVKRKKVIPFSTSAAPAYRTPSNVYEEVYNTPEIRQRILSFLPREVLIKIVTLEKKIVADVAKELYHTVTYRQVKKMRRTTEARAICADAVRCVTFDAPPITADLQKRWPELQEKYGRPKPARRRPASLQRYDDSAVDIIIADIRKTCPKLKTLKHEWKPATGRYMNRAGDDWKVTLNRTEGKEVCVDSVVKLSSNDTLDVLGNYVTNAHTRIRIDYELHLYRTISKTCTHWCRFFEKALESNKNIRKLDLGVASITLAQLVTFLEACRSMDSMSIDHDENSISLETVIGEQMSIVNVDELRRLGITFGEHLTYLNLQHRRAGPGHLQLRDLDELETTEQRDLPNLSALALTFDYHNDTEAECLSRLQSRMSMRTGRLYTLDIGFAEAVDVHRLFNLARRLNPFIRQSFSMLLFHARSVYVECAAFCDALSDLEESRADINFTMDMTGLGIDGMNDIEDLGWDGSQTSQSDCPPFYYATMSIEERLEKLKRAEEDSKRLSPILW